MVRHFRILRGVKVRVIGSKRYAAQSAFSVDGKRATIYAWSGKAMPDDFEFHEVLHVILNRFKRTMIQSPTRLRAVEEHLVPDTPLIHI